MQILKHILIDLLKSRMIVFYSAFLFVLTLSVLWFSGQEAKAIVTLQNITLLVAPLMAIVFSSSYIYNSRDFMALLLTQPIKRSKVFWSFYGAMAISLSLAIFIGFGLPIIIYNATSVGLSLLLLTILLNLVFVALGVWVATRITDKAKGLGAALLLWLFLTLVYDGLALLVLYWFQEYPLMTPVVIITSLNPVDLTRVSLLLQIDISALMGFTGAVYKEFFSSNLGTILSVALLLIWSTLPLFVSQKRFVTKDF
ncbi:MAG: ABC transporter permease subunit [Bacteroidia bacterium]